MIIGSRGVWRLAGAMAVLTAVLAPSVARGAVRYASPTGAATPPACAQATPCGLDDAINGTGVTAGDVIRLLPGTYDLGGSAQGVYTPVTIEGEPGAAVPLIQNDGETSFSVEAGGIGSVLRGLKIAVNDYAGGAALRVNGPAGSATFERVHVTATGTTLFGVQLAGTMRDSVVDFRGASFGGGIVTCCGGATIRNVTAIGSSPGTYGIVMYDGYGQIQTATIRNTIARGTAAGIRVEGSNDGGLVTADVASSNFDTATETILGDDALVLGAGNQTGSPLFADAAAGDFRQLPGSPTIDAGDPAGISAQDFDGQPRAMGPAPDIGADEAPDGATLLTLAPGKLKRARTLRIPASCGLDCNVAMASRLVLKGSSGGARSSRVIGLKVASGSLSGGAPGSIVLSLKKSAVKALKGAKKAKLNVTASVTGQLGFTGTEQTSYRFK